MRKIYDAVVVTGEYQDRQGNTKKRYLTVGAVFEGERGMSLKLEALPVSFNGWISFYPVREQSETRRQPSPRRDPDPQGAPFDDDIPF